MRYVTLGASTLEDLDVHVNKAIQKGFVPVGGVAINPQAHTNKYVQALISTDDSDKEKVIEISN